MNNGAARVVIESFFVTSTPTLGGTAYTDRKIEMMRFADGTVWNSAQIAAGIEAGAPNALVGTAADNTFVVDSDLDTVSELPNGGTDTIQSSVSYALPANVERLVLTGVLDTNGWGNAANPANYLAGNDGNNVFNGPGGPTNTVAGGANGSYAFMSGGKGDDTYYNGSSGTVFENPNEGTDTIILTHGAGNFTLPSNVENLIDLNGAFNRPADGPDYLTGNDLDNFLGYKGGASGHMPYVINGGKGADTMQGFTDDDVYYVDNAGDRVLEPSAGAGAPQSFDEIRSYITFELPDNIEALTLIGSASDGWGNALDNRIDGSTNGVANNLYGGMGDDLYVVDGSDVVIEKPGEGLDTVEYRGTGTRTYTTEELADNVEGIALGEDLGASNAEGDSADNLLNGNASANMLSGGSAMTVSAGGDGDDILEGGWRQRQAHRRLGGRHISVQPWLRGRQGRRYGPYAGREPFGI